MRFRLAFSAALPLMLVAPSAFAQDPVAHTAIASGDYSAAEQTLRSELRIYPGRPELLLNLAAVYMKTGREAEARAIYMKVLSQRDVLMDVSADRTVGSHVVATNGLKRLQTGQLSSR